MQGLRVGAIFLYWVVLETTQAGVCVRASSATPPALAACLSGGTCYHLQAPARLQTLMLCFGD